MEVVSVDQNLSKFWCLMINNGVFNLNIIVRYHSFDQFLNKINEVNHN